MREKERIYHSEDGEIPGSNVDFGARLDDSKTQSAIDKRELGVIKEMPHGIGRQIIVKAGSVPLPLKILGGLAVFSGASYGTYRGVRWLMKIRDKEHFEVKKKQDSPK